MTSTELTNRNYSPPATPSRSLYPIQPDRGIDSLLAAILTGEKDADGKLLLVMAPTADQRRTLVARRDHLATHLAPMPDGGIARLVSEMLAGFGSSRADEKTAAGVVSQYVKELRGLPGWAISRACSRFARGEVGPDEVEGVNRGFAPSTAQLCTVARRMVQLWREQHHQIHLALTGRVEHKQTPEERERVGALLRGLADDLKVQRAAEDAERKAGGKAIMDRANDLAMRRECERAGVDPAMGVSPSLLAKLPGGAKEMGADENSR